MRILGIDAGSSSIKSVEMDSAFGRFDIHDYHECPIDPGETREEAIAKLVKGLAKKPDRIIVALPTGHSTHRNLQLPTRNKKAVQAGVGFELEDELPFPLEDSTYDYAILSQGKQGSQLHVSATLKRHMVAAIEMWRNAQANPDIITSEAWAYRTLMNRVLGPVEQQQTPVLLVQIGNEKTTFYLHNKGVPVISQELRWGGRDLTLALCDKYGIPFDQAETVKLDHGFVSQPDTHQEVTQEQLDFSKCLEGCLERLALEIRQVDLTSKSVTQQSIGSIYLAGGTSLLPGIAQWVEGRAKIPAQSLLALSSITSSGVTYSLQTDARFLLAAALTLTQVGPDKTNTINFRTGEFSKEVSSRKLNLEAFRRPLIALGITSFCLFLSLIVQSSVYKSRLNTTNTLLEKSVRSFFGQMSSSALRSYMSNTSTLRNSVTKELNKQKELTKLMGPSTRSPLEFLNALSATIPRDVIVDMLQFQAGTPQTDPFSASEAAASLSFQVANPQMAEKLANLVSSKLSGMQRGKMEEALSADNTVKKWKVSFSGKTTEDSYGK